MGRVRLRTRTRKRARGRTNDPPTLPTPRPRHPTPGGDSLHADGADQARAGLFAVWEGNVMTWGGPYCQKCHYSPAHVTRDGVEYCSDCDPLSPRKVKNRAKKARQMKKKGKR